MPSYLNGEHTENLTLLAQLRSFFMQSLLVARGKGLLIYKPALPSEYLHSSDPFDHRRLTTVSCAVQVSTQATTAGTQRDSLLTPRPLPGTVSQVMHRRLSPVKPRGLSRKAYLFLAARLFPHSSQMLMREGMLPSSMALKLLAILWAVV